MLPLYHGEKENQRYFCLWSILWSKPLLCRFRQSGKILQTQASQGFAAFRLTLSRIPPRHSQSRRATNCATPGYSVYLSGWPYSPKPGAIPTSLYPDIHFSAMIPRRRGKSKIFLSVVILHFSHPTMPRGKKQQEAGDGYSNFCVGFFFSTLISTERLLPTFVWDFSFYPQFRVSDFFQLLCGISSE